MAKRIITLIDCIAVVVCSSILLYGSSRFIISPTLPCFVERFLTGGASVLPASF